MKNIKEFCGIGDIKFFPEKNRLSEITQTMNLRYAFVNENLEMTHQYVKCRDFLHDAIRGQLTETTVSKYGFTYSPNKNPNICLDRTIMLVEYPKNEEPKIKSAMGILNGFERIAYRMIGNKQDSGLTRAVRVNVFDPNVHHILFTSPKAWQTIPASISLYTLLIKIAQYDINKRLYPENLLSNNAEGIQKLLNTFFDSAVKQSEEMVSQGKVSPIEIGYLQKIRPLLFGFAKGQKDLFEFEKNGYASIYYDTSVPISTFHDNYGIVGLLTGRYKGLPTDKINSMLVNEVKNKGLKISKNEELKTTNNKFDTTFAKDNPYGPSFGLVARRDKNFRYITTSLTADRGGLIMAVKAKVDNEEAAPALAHIDVEKLRLLTVGSSYSTPLYSEKMKLAKKAINKIEKAAGFEENTKISEAFLGFNVTHTKTLYLLTGPGAWIRSPYLFFTFQTIITGVINSNIKVATGTKMLDKKDGISEFLEYVADNPRIKTSANNSLKLIAEKLPLVIDGIDLFTQDSLEKNYETLNNNKNVGNVFESLFTFGLKNDALNDSLKEMWESKQKEKNGGKQK